MLSFETLDHGALAIAALALMVIHQLLGIVKDKGVEWWDSRRGNGPAGAIRRLQATVEKLDHSIELLKERLDGQPPYPQCYYDKAHFDRIEQIEKDVNFISESQAEQRRQIDQGRFTCRLSHEHVRAIERLSER